MTDIAILASTAKVTLQDLARQAKALGTGLENAAPVNPIGTPNNAVQYLLGTGEALAKFAQACEQFTSR